MIDTIWNKYFIRQFSDQLAIGLFIFFVLPNPQTKAEHLRCSQVFQHGKSILDTDKDQIIDHLIDLKLIGLSNLTGFDFVHSLPNKHN